MSKYAGRVQVRLVGREAELPPGSDPGIPLLLLLLYSGGWAASCNTHTSFLSFIHPFILIHLGSYSLESLLRWKKWKAKRKKKAKKERRHKAISWEKPIIHSVIHCPLSSHNSYAPLVA
ncbi:hypothetical protein F5Y17DRAFT_300894 [Xylariaceae sp. FL0594]|nr:hypothetical protein F5Y17DRAFT_300894 [Xylariaceae sp. FL0594]